MRHSIQSKGNSQMKLFKPLVAVALLACAVLSLAAPARADLSPQQVWNRAVQRIRSAKDYTLGYNYTGPKGEFVFTYAAVRPNQVKTTIVKGENAGAVLIYNPDEYGNEVRARKGFLGKGLALNDPKVAGTPIIQPVFDMLLEKTRNATVTSGGDSTVMGHAVYVLNVTADGILNVVAVDKANFDVLHWKYADREGTQDRTFYDIQMNVQPRIGF